MCNNICAFLYVCSFLLLVNCRQVQEIKHPTTSNRHALVRPIVHQTRTKRQLSTTRQENGSHHHELLVTVDIEGKPYTLDLKLNHDLLPEGHTISYQEGEKTVLHKPKKEEIDFCQYTGYIRGIPNSWAALSTCYGLRGAINDGTKIRYIDPSEGSDLQSLHYIYDQSEVQTEQRCGNDDLFPNQESYIQKTRHKREFPIRGGPYNATESSRYVKLVLVADTALYRGVNGNLKKLYHQLQQSTNILHAIYAPLNIFVALTGVEVWTTRDGIQLSSDSTKTLDGFMQYRREQLLRTNRDHDHAQLITAQKFDEGVVGKAYVSKMGSYELSGAIVHRPAYISSADTFAFTASIMAHEMGHSFGMSHDNTTSGCQDKYCIMYFSAVKPISVHFSKDSLKELMLRFNRGLEYSLRDKPDRLFGAPSCGNGFVDPGEECDCGVGVTGIKPSGCQRCCDPKMCRLRPKATCAMGACCNLKTCQMKSVATLCRAADNECDLPEYCSGDSEYCPEDVFKMDTTPCSDKAYCVQGKCRSHESQCRLLWGSTAENCKRDFYEHNRNGNDFSNCGYDVLSKRSKRCGEKDVACGRLYCQHVGPELKFGYYSSYTKNFYTSSNGISLCNAVRMDTVSAVDPGLVPDGAECGAGQMCLHQQCVAVEDARAQVVRHHSEGCRANCSGHGICNSKGQCHCDDGFAPPLCNLPGVGGSDHSGPAQDPEVQKSFKLLMYIIFLGIVPLIALILLLIFFMKRKALLCFDKNANTHRSLSSNTSLKKAILSLFDNKGSNLFNNKESYIESTNTSTDINNARPEYVKDKANYDIKIIRDVKAIVAQQSKFDINSYVNYRNGTQESVMKLTKDDIKLILSGTFDGQPTPLANEDDNVNKNYFGEQKAIENIKIDVKSTYPNLAIPTRHKARNAYNLVCNTAVKQDVVVRNIMKDELKPKTIDKVKPLPNLKSTNNNQANNVNPLVYGNIETRPQNILQNNVGSNSIPYNHGIAKRPTEKNVANTAHVLRNEKHQIETNIDIKFKPGQKNLIPNKPIPHQKPSKHLHPSKPKQTPTKGTKTTKDVSKVISENTSEPWPRLKPVKNSHVLRNNLEIIEKTNGLPKSGMNVTTMKNFYEHL